MKMRTYLLPCLLCASQACGMKVNLKEIKDNFLTIKEELRNKGSVFVAHTLHLQHNFYNEHHVKAETLEVAKEFTGSGVCIANTVKLLASCTKFESGFLQARELQITNPLTAISLSASGANIGALYKKEVYLGKINCLFGASMYGDLYITDGRPNHEKKYHFWGLWYDVNKILSDGVTKAHSVDELVAYLQDHLS